MNKPPLYLVLKRMERFPLHVRINHLRNLLDKEPDRSIRARDIREYLSKVEMIRQLRKEIRQDNVRKAS